MSDTRGITTIPGIDNFGGVIVKPAQWNRDGDYRGKRIAYIGNSPDSVRLIPEISHVAEHLTVFQPSLLPVPNVPPLRPGLPLLRNTVRAAANAGMDALVAGFGVVRGRVPMAAKAAEWAQYARTYTLPNVDYVADTIARITPTGIETTGDTHYPADIIVYDTPLPLPPAAEPEPAGAESATTVDDAESDTAATETVDPTAVVDANADTEPADVAPEAVDQPHAAAESTDDVTPDGGVADTPPAAPQPVLKKAPTAAKKAAVKKAAPAKASAKKAAAKKAPAKKTAAKKAASTNRTPAHGSHTPNHTSQTPSHPSQTPAPTKKMPSPAKKAPQAGKKTAAKKPDPAKKTPAKKSLTKKANPHD